MPYLHELVQAAADEQVSLATALRRVLILAYKLRHQPLKDWVNWELMGYSTRDQVPDYRKVRGVAYGMIGDLWHHYNKMKIFTSYLPENHSHLVGIIPMSVGVARLESLAGEGSTASISWPQEVAGQYGAKGYDGFECINAWTEISQDQIKGVLDCIRTRILSLALEFDADVKDKTDDLWLTTFSAEHTTMVMLRAGFNSVEEGFFLIVRSAFSPGEIEPWVRNIYGADMAADLPGPTASHAQMASAVMDLLRRHGRIDQNFLASLRRYAPSYTEAIDYMANQLSQQD